MGIANDGVVMREGIIDSAEGPVGDGEGVGVSCKIRVLICYSAVTNFDITEFMPFLRILVKKQRGFNKQTYTYKQNRT